MTSIDMKKLAGYALIFGPENTRLVNSITGICFFKITLVSKILEEYFLNN